MRNILVYPVTHDEKIAVLRRCQELLRKDEADAIGGIDQYALSLVIEEYSYSENHRTRGLKN